MGVKGPPTGRPIEAVVGNRDGVFLFLRDEKKDLLLPMQFRVFTFLLAAVTTNNDRGDRDGHPA